MPLQNDGLLWISTGRDRRDKSWKNKQLLWSDLVTQLSATVHTRETVKEYSEMTLDQQGAIKDVGGFVGGTINGGRRVKRAITGRSLITLDLDYAPLDFIDDLTLVYGFAFVLYSTHKHTPEKPRFRLVIPLTRDVFPDEYEAVSRMVAASIEMSYFDSTTFQPERLMYWPSTPADGQYYFQTVDAPWLDPDRVLDRYKDWKDISQWPVHAGETKRVAAHLKKQVDPLEKPGVIGAFCRVYGIEEVIEKYLHEKYTATDHPDRYTFTGGSTSGGLVVYENKFTYSHHSTDPTSGVLCNAFDLVRLHLFRDLDADALEGTPGNKLPSFIAMCDYAVADADVRLLIGKERVSGALEDFAGILSEGESATGDGGDGSGDPAAPVQLDLDWLKLMDVDRKGNYYNTIENICTVLRHDISLKGKLRLNAFTMREMVTGRLPWTDKHTSDRPITDADEASLRRYLETVYKLTATNKIRDAIMITVYENQYHPVRNYLQGLSWDGQPRIDSLLVDLFDAEDSLYTRAVMRKTLIAAVARVFNPGVKFDTVLVLVGPQGCGKSTFIDRLGGQWYSDSFGNMKTNAAAEQLQGVWTMEIGELAGLKKAEVEEIKLFISKRFDQFRAAYARYVGTFWRQCIFIGTTNNDDFLLDPTGGRRFWPVRVTLKLTGNVFDSLDKEEVAQIWAEALQAYQAGEDLHLTPEIEAMAKVQQTEHTEKDDRTDLIKIYLEKLLPIGWAKMNTYSRIAFLRGDDELSPVGTVRRESVTVAEIWYELFEGKIREMNTYNTKPIHNILKNLEGWTLSKGRKTRTVYGVLRQYVRDEDDL